MVINWVDVVSVSQTRITTLTTRPNNKMPAPSSSNNNNGTISDLAARCEELWCKREEEDRVIEAKMEAIRQREEEERLAEEKRKAEMRRIEEAQRRSELEEKARALAEKR